MTTRTRNSWRTPPPPSAAASPCPLSPLPNSPRATSTCAAGGAWTVRSGAWTRPLSGGFFTPSNVKKKFLRRRRNSDGDAVNDSSDDGWVTASGDEDLDDDDQEEVEDSATLVRNPAKGRHGGEEADAGKPRALRFTRDSSVLAPEPCPEMAGVPRAEIWRETPTLLRHRQGGRLEPWEAVRCRRIALPNTPHTAHSIMFLNHQPGETSDFTDTLQRGTKGPGDSELHLEAGGQQEEGEGDKKLDRFPRQFGQWDGVEGYSSGTLPSARNIVEACRRRETRGEGEETHGQKQASAETEGTERLFEPGTGGTTSNVSSTNKSTDRPEEASLATGAESKSNTELDGAKSPESEKKFGLGGSLESLKSHTMRRRSANSKLPPVPTPEVSGNSPVGSPPTSPPADGRSFTISPAHIIQEDVESLAETSSLYDDHVYDVPSDVIARAANESTPTHSDAENASFADSSVSENPAGVPNKPNAPQLERKDSLDEILPLSPSDGSLFDTNSLFYNFYPTHSARNTATTANDNNSNNTNSITETNTENYIYNGSLLSVLSSASDTASALYYHHSSSNSNDQQPMDPLAQARRLHEDPAAILRTRLKAGDGSVYGRPIIFMMGGKPVVLSQSWAANTDQDDHTGPDSVSASLTFRDGHDLGPDEGSHAPVTVDLNSDMTASGVYGPGSSTYPTAPGGLQCDCAGCCPGGAGLIPLDACTKLKLWDLRLICLNREENQYSTYPPRRPTLDDRGVGPTDAAGDVSTDQYVTRKIERLLRAPVITRAGLPDTRELRPLKDGAGASALSASGNHPDLPDFPTDGLRSLYRSCLEGEDVDSLSSSVLGKNHTPLSSVREEVFVGSALTPSVPSCLNPYRTLTKMDAAKCPGAFSWPAGFSNSDKDGGDLGGWQSFFSRQAWSGSGRDEDAAINSVIMSGRPRPLPADWPSGVRGEAVRAGVDSGEETDDSVYVYKPLGLAGMYQWGRGRGRSPGDDSSSSNISGDDVSNRRNHQHYKKRRHYNGHHHHHHNHRYSQHVKSASEKSHVDSLLIRKKGSTSGDKDNHTHHHRSSSHHHYHNNSSNHRNIVVMTSDVDEDSPAYDSSSIYNNSIRSGCSSSVYYGGTSNLSTSTSRSNLNNINSNNNPSIITDGGSGSYSSSDSNNRRAGTVTGGGGGDKARSSRASSPGRGGGRAGADMRGSQVIWGDASIVDWRSQADKFRENHFITLIL
ncbi:hypothetical protein EGW08_012109 [Elysia chlorotica]|uniref:Uncharacterized protein n=1 Tax=Elysia chlorotica TaxID=188477 RepID=A0A3S0ZQ02_ELYCH|nr:hypothetical protein EGW08_012109 [Elysia chlorotica]